MKYIIFDLDETLGYFKQIYYLFTIIKKVDSSIQITQNMFNNILELFPEILRPNILHVLLYLKNKKKELTTYIIIYTNNKNKEWTSFIINYITAKISCPSFFDKTIGNPTQELCRTSKDKNLSDLFRCIDFTEGSRICYIDNEYFKGMKSKYTTYLKLDNYVNDIPNDNLLQRFTESDIYNTSFPNISSSVFKKIYYHYLNSMYNHTLSAESYEYETASTNILLSYIKIFYLNSRPSRTNFDLCLYNSPSSSRTLKNRIYRVKRNGKTKKCKFLL